jgi:dihydroorotate dehydrogenase (fumarate)
MTPDLRTSYLGLELKNPVIAGAGPLSDDIDGVRHLEDAGVAAIVLRSLFEEQVTSEVLATHRALFTSENSYGESLTFLPDPDDFVMGPHAYLEHVRRVVERVDVPVIGSLNGTSPGGWQSYAKLIEEAGADALELNLYRVPTAASDSGAHAEEETVMIVREVAGSISIPLAVKLSPYYTSLAHVCHRLADAGARGIVLFNRFFEPDIDVDTLEYVAELNLSDPSELRARLRWIALLSGQVDADLAVTGGVHDALDVVKSLLAGADAVQMVSALLRRGPRHAADVLTELEQWLAEYDYPSVADLQGTMNVRRCPNPEILGRANYARLLQTWSPIR